MLINSGIGSMRKALLEWVINGLVESPGPQPISTRTAWLHQSIYVGQARLKYHGVIFDQVRRLWPTSGYTI